jgi:phosphoketolase
MTKALNGTRLWPATISRQWSHWQLLRQHLPNIKVSLVKVVDLFKLVPIS